MPFSNQTKKKLVTIVIVFFLFVLSIAVPALVLSIALQSSDEVIIQDEEPLNKKQGLPSKLEPDDGYRLLQ
jgi:hypothetical protein